MPQNGRSWPTRVNINRFQAPSRGDACPRVTSCLYPLKPGLQSVTAPRSAARPGGAFLDRNLQKGATMKTRTFRFFSVAALALSALSVGVPALAHDGFFYGHRHYGRPHFVYPGQRIVIVRPPVFASRPVYRPGPVYYTPAPLYYAPPASAYYPAPAPVYYQQPWGTLGGAIAGAAIGGAVGDGRPGAIAAGSVIGAVIGNGLSR